MEVTQSVSAWLTPNSRISPDEITEYGELLPIMDLAGGKFSELINAVTAYAEAGKAAGHLAHPTAG